MNIPNRHQWKNGIGVTILPSTHEGHYHVVTDEGMTEWNVAEVEVIRRLTMDSIVIEAKQQEHTDDNVAPYMGRNKVIVKRAITTDTACDSKCWQAYHPVCRCSCGGANHGVAYDELRVIEYHNLLLGEVIGDVRNN